MRFIRILPALLFLIICIMISPVHSVNSVSSAVYQTANTIKIIIDPGHGGFDGGAQGADKTLEKDINLSISLKLKEMLRFGGYEVIMTRETDIGTENNSSESIAKRKVNDMKKRLEIIKNNPDAVFVSVHLNKFTSSSAAGAQIFYSPNNVNSKLLAESLQKSFFRLLQPQNDRTVKKAGNSIYLLKNAQIPAVIAECGFLSNHEELNLLKSDEYQSKIAFVICCGLKDYFTKN